MPSSGSTTSRIASSRSASSSSLGAAVSLIVFLQFVAGLSQSVFECHPAQQRAFHAGRVLGDTRECDAVSQYIFVTLNGSARRNHLGERRHRRQGVPDALADHLIGQHRRRGLADRTALPVIGNVGDPLTVVAQSHPEPDLVAARRVHLKGLGTVRLPQPAVMRALVVIEDHFLIELLQPHCQPLPKNSTACRTPATSRSTSSSVLYTANDARAVAAMPNRRCSGHAQW